MGNETILYYAAEESITGKQEHTKTYFRKRTKLRSFVTEEDGISVVAVLVPYSPGGWKKEKLFRRIRESLAEYPNITESAERIVQPELSRMLSEQEKRPFSFCSEDSPEIFWRLAGNLTEKTFGAGKFPPKRAVCPESVFLLLGNSVFPEEQMRRFAGMMQPYFPYINHLTVLYEPDDADADSIQEYMEEALWDYTETFHYEYGLVSQVWRGSEYPVKNYHAGDKKGITFCFDCGYEGKIPLRALGPGDVYLDIFSSENKTTLFRRKRMEISCLSPLKYLDTVVKSGYDKLVNQALCR